MSKTIFITGSTDGIGLETARVLAANGHQIILHGRNAQKLKAAQDVLGGNTAGYLADLSHMSEVYGLAEQVRNDFSNIDVLINNAGILKTPNTRTADNFDIRFAVNTYAPFLLSRELMPLLQSSGRIVNIASAAQAPVNLQALKGDLPIGEDFQAYAQSKLAVIMLTNDAVTQSEPNAPMMVSVNPGSLLSTKMVKEGFGQEGNDIGIGVDILSRAALSDEFAQASGRYYDNDARRFGQPHPDALDGQKCRAVREAVEARLDEIL